MPIDPEDPRLTAYALGELEGDERADLERFLSESDEGRRMVDAVRETARLVASSLAMEVAPGLTPAHLKTIEIGINEPSTVPYAPGGSRAWPHWAGYGVAASLLVGFGLSAAWMIGTAGRAPEVAHRTAPDDRLFALGRDAKPEAVAPAPAPLDMAEEVPPPAGWSEAKAPDRGGVAHFNRAKDVLNEVEGRTTVVIPSGPAALGLGAMDAETREKKGAAKTARDESNFAYKAPAPAPPGAAPPAERFMEADLSTKAGRRTIVERSAQEAPLARARSAGRAAQLGDRMSDELGKREAAASRGAAKAADSRFGTSLAPSRSGGAGMGGMGGMAGDQAAGMGGGMPGGRPRGLQVPGPATAADGKGFYKKSVKTKEDLARANRADETRLYARMPGITSGGTQPNAGPPGQPGDSQGGKPGQDQAPTGKPGKPQSAKPDAGQPGKSGENKPGEGQSGKTGDKPADKSGEGKPGEGPPAKPSDPQARTEGLALLKEAEAKLQDGAVPAGVVRLEDEARQLAAADAVQEQLVQAPAAEPPGTEGYNAVKDNDFEATAAKPLSTFSTDVDTASYANIRRFLMAENRMPPKDAVRIEEMLNYFPYDYPAAKVGDADAPPFSVNVEVARCPWNADHRLAKIGLKGKVEEKRLVSNLVFLIDVSGSMDEANKLPLVQTSLRMLADQLGENDRVAIVVYAGAAGMVLDSTSGLHKAEIASSIDQLRAGGSTAGGAGITLAYDVAAKHLVKGGTNRVILCTDGDFNVGVSDDKALEALAAEKAKTGVFLTVLGFGTGNLKDAKMEGIADKGNGHYHYIDSLIEARKVLVEQMVGTLVTIAKDVKVQVDFNPAKVGSYRLIGYENRILKAEDFNNDQKDAGEIGAGHTVTALYELTPPEKDPFPADLASRYVTNALKDPKNGEAFTVRLRYKAPDGSKSSLYERPATDDGKDFAAASADFKFASSVAAFGMILRGSEHRGNATFNGLLEWAEAGKGDDPSGYRKEFGEMVKKARDLSGGR